MPAVSSHRFSRLLTISVLAVLVGFAVSSARAEHGNKTHRQVIVQDGQRRCRCRVDRLLPDHLIDPVKGDGSL